MSIISVVYKFLLSLALKPEYIYTSIVWDPNPIKLTFQTKKAISIWQARFLFLWPITYNWQSSAVKLKLVHVDTHLHKAYDSYFTSRRSFSYVTQSTARIIHTQFTKCRRVCTKRLSHWFWISNKYIPSEESGLCACHVLALELPRLSK